MTHGYDLCAATSGLLVRESKFLLASKAREMQALIEDSYSQLAIELLHHSAVYVDEL